MYTIMDDLMFWHHFKIYTIKKDDETGTWCFIFYCKDVQKTVINVNFSAKSNVFLKKKDF